MDYFITSLPSPEQIRQLPLFQNLNPEHILVIHCAEQCLQIEDELKQIPIFGFDTESKPTFIKGEVSTGPHLIQLATRHKAYLFQVNSETLAFLRPFFASQTQLKVGFGLKNDAKLFRNKGIELNNTIELSTCFKSFGFNTSMGVKNAMALLFKLHFPKNKKISTSNWSKRKLSPEQIGYATADAYAAFLIFEKLLELQQIRL